MLRVLAVAILAAGPAKAQVSEAEARAMMFPVKGHTIQVSGKLSDFDKTVVTGVIPLMAKELRQPVRYYASIAYSPDDGLVHEALQAAMNYHSVAAADAAAIAACDAFKSTGAQSCQVAARVVPKGYEASALTLSVDATDGFNRTFRRSSELASFAVSDATGAWGMGANDSAAIEQCGAQDCRVVIRK